MAGRNLFATEKPKGRNLFAKKEEGSVRSFVEPLAAIGSSIIAEPIAGIAGAAQALNPFAEEGAGAKAVEATREALTYQPRTERGQETLGEIGGLLEPAASAMQAAEKTLGDIAYDETESPTLAAAYATIPTAIAEVLGIASGRGVIKSTRGIKGKVDSGKISKAIADAAPDIDTLKDTSRGIFNEIDEIGGRVKSNAYNKLVGDMQVKNLKGMHEKITPAAYAAFDEFKKLRGSDVSLSDLDNLRELAGNAAGSINKREAMLGVRMIEMVDDFLGDIDPRQIKTPAGVDASKIGSKYKIARDLWGRARKSEAIQEAFEKARNQASGFENGVRTQFRGILNNRRKSKFFNKTELNEMRKVVRGTKGQNILKLLGKFGFGEGQATSMLGGSIGVAGGAAVGGPAGAVAVPMIGQVSKKLAQRLTVKGAEFADKVVRAGKDGRKITEAYLKNTPKAQRSAAELSELLTRSDIALDKLPKIPLANEAKLLTNQRRAELTGLLATQSRDNYVER